MRERGLKLTMVRSPSTTNSSLPMRERGLKYLNKVISAREPGRSPCGSVD